MARSANTRTKRRSPRATAKTETKRTRRSPATAAAASAVTVADTSAFEAALRDRVDGFVRDVAGLMREAAFDAVNAALRDALRARVDGGGATTSRRAAAPALPARAA